MHLPAGAGDDLFGAQVLEQGGDLQGALEVLPDGDEADVVLADAQGAQEFLLRGVADLGVRHQGEHLVHAGFVPVHGHDLAAHFVQLFRDGHAEAAETDQKHGFHGGRPPFLFHGTLLYLQIDSFNQR